MKKDRTTMEYKNSTSVWTLDNVRRKRISRIKKGLIGNELGRSIYHFIEENPGTHYSELKRRLGISKGTLSRQLTRLEEAERIKHQSDGHFKFFYTVNETTCSQPLTPKQKKIIDLINENPGSTYQEMAMKLGRTPEGILYHVKTLRRMDLVGSRKVNYSLQWFPSNGND